MSIHRRTFLRGAAAGLGAFAATRGLARLASTAHAASLTRYAGHRSLVSLFLFGGNDGNNLLVPKAPSEYARYRAARPGLAFASSELLTIAPSNLGAQFGLHPSLSRLRAAFQAGQASLVANVGPAARPTTPALFRQANHPRPQHLQSHSDQQDAWASGLPIPSDFPTAFNSGWGGRLGDAVGATNPPVAGRPYPAATMLGGRRLFATGAAAPLVVSTEGELGFPELNNASLQALRNSATASIAGIRSGALQGEVGVQLGGAVDLSGARRDARAAAWAQLSNHAAIDALYASYAPGPLLAQIYAVLQDIVAGATPRASQGLGLKRQVFSVGLGGFDNHSGQRAAQDPLLVEVDNAVDLFRRGLAMIESGWPSSFGLPPQSTLFTMSDFGRTLVENANAGTDHAWGNHMFVVGNRVDGGLLHGRFPSLDLGTSPDAIDDEGRWVPSLCTDQYVYDLALWLGVSAAEASEIFPNLAGYTEFARNRGMDAIYRQLRIPLMVAD
jgi:uncharacterized protein (DUF1501 family)